MLLSASLTFSLLVVGAHAGSLEQDPRGGAALEAADVVWSYDTGG
jgi:hypothetical protein